jgi:Ca-activated chloride channel family protein
MSTMTGFAPLGLLSREPLKLSMQKLWLTGHVLAVGARLWVRHEFVSQETKPVEVIYGFVLPREASLRRFRVTGDDFTVDSELRPTDEAYKLYEQGIRSGSLSTLARQYGDGLVNLTVGNIRPGEKVVVLLELLAGVELHDDSLRLRFPFTLAPSYHAQARSIEIAPGVVEMELPAEQFDDLILPQFVQHAEHLHQVGFCLDVQMTGAIQEIASPSHALRVQTSNAECSRVSLSRESDVPNRDLVLDIRTRPLAASVLAGSDSKGKGRFAAVIPSTQFGKLEAGPRRLVILLDRSGSMEGTPLTQAKKAIEACLGALDAHDFFGLVAFSNGATPFKTNLAEGSTENRRDAQKFLQGISSAGGTELAAGVEAAAKLLKDEAGDILIITDGQVFGTETILERARSTGVRLHCLGIGSASQDRFLAQLAAHTGGVSRFLTPIERIDLPAVELFASIGRPVAENVTVAVEGATESQILPVPSRCIFSGTPLLVCGELAPATPAQLKIRWQVAKTEAQLTVPISMNMPALGNTLKLLQGSHILSDLESRAPTSLRSGVAARKEVNRLHHRVLELSTEYGLASSQMSLVAVVKRGGDVAGEIPKTQIVPIGVPQDMGFDECGSMDLSAMPAAAATLALPSSLLGQIVTGAQRWRSRGSGISSFMRGFKKLGSEASPSPEPAVAAADVQLALAGMLEPDGGMPGKTVEIRIANSLAVLLYFVSQGSTSHAGPFRVHVAKLIRYLIPELVNQLDPSIAHFVLRTLETVSTGKSLKGDWIQHASSLSESKALDLGRFWRQLAEALPA